MKSKAEEDEYRLQQASTCHAAATSSVSLAAKQAFLELEQGWLRLMEKVADTARGGEETCSQPHARLRRKRRQPHRAGGSQSQLQDRSDTMDVSADEISADNLSSDRRVIGTEG